MIIRYARVCALAVLLAVQVPLYATYCVPPSPTPQQALPDPPLPLCCPVPNASSALGGGASNDVCSKSPCYLASGTYIRGFVDLQIPTAGMYPITVSRRYDSSRPTDGPLGVGWSSSLTAHLYYAAYLVAAPSTYSYEADVVMPSGMVYRFIVNGTSFTSPAGSYDVLVKNGDGTYSLTLARTRSVYRFNTDGSPVSLTDDYGNAITYSYDAFGRLHEIADASGSGRYVDVTWGPDGRIASLTDSAGRVLKYSYDTNGTLTGYSDPVASSDSSIRTTYYAYTSGRFGQLLTRIEDRWHRTISDLTWYSDGRLKSYTDGDYSDTNPSSSPGEKYAYAYSGGSATKSHSLGFKTYAWAPSGVVYDSIVNFDISTGLQTRDVFPDGHSVTYTYNARGNVATATPDSGAVTWTYTYDSNYPDSISSIISSQPTQWAGWKYRYNSAAETPPGALADIKQVANDGVSTTIVSSFVYDAKGRTTIYIDSNGQVWIYAYDPAGNLTSVTTGGNSTRYDYDSLGRVIKVTSPSGQATNYVYDDDDRVKSITLPSPGTVPALNFTTTISYDNFDATTGLASVISTDPNGRVVTRGYDALGHLLRLVDPAGNVTLSSYQYNLLHSMTDANGNVTSYQYNADRYLQKTTFFDGTFETYTRYSTGGLFSMTDRRGQTVTYAHDAFGRLTSVLFGSAGGYSFGYSGQNLTGVSDTRSATPYPGIGYTYDSNWHVASETQFGGDKITYTYAGDRIASYHVDPPSGQAGTAITASLLYDTAGRLSTLEWSPVSGTFTFAYNADSQYTSIQFPNGQSRTFSYDNQGRLTSLANLDTNAHNFATFTYAYDYSWTSQSYASLGDRTSVAVSGPALPNGTTKYAYDANQQLTSVTRRDGTYLTYDYDAIGNRTRVGGPNGATYYQYTYFQNSAQHNSPRLQNATGPVLGYDANGNLTTEGSSSFTWDGANQMVGIYGAQYKYDYQGRHTLFTPAPGYAAAVRYVSLGLHTIAERSTDPTRTNDYLFGPGIDQPLARRASDGSIQYYVVDGLGSVVAQTDPAGVVTQSATYDEWGNVLSGSVDFFGYTGLELARPGVNLWFNRARYDRSTWGRFVSEDPLGIAGGINPYAYALNSPADLSDPMGLQAATTCCNGKGGFGICWNKKPSDPVLAGCIEEHENDHIDYLSKNPGQCAGQCYDPQGNPRPPGYDKFQMPPADHDAMECRGYETEVHCLEKKWGQAVDKKKAFDRITQLKILAKTKFSCNSKNW